MTEIKRNGLKLETRDGDNYDLQHSVHSNAQSTHTTNLVLELGHSNISHATFKCTSNDNRRSKRR